MSRTVRQGSGARPSKPDDTVKRLSPNEPLWEAEPAPREAAPGPSPSRRRSELRVNALLATAAALLLAVGFLLGATLTDPNSNTKGPAPAASPATTGVQPPLPTSPPASGRAGQGAAPQPCMVAMERADQVISYLVARIRDQRLSDSVQAFVDARRACQQAAR